jgi:hypothetical protein
MALFDLGKCDIRYPERIQHMHALYGRAPGKNCQSCRFLARQKRGSKTYLKCTQTIITHGYATDWRAGFPACGKYEEI